MPFSKGVEAISFKRNCALVTAFYTCSFSHSNRQLFSLFNSKKRNIKCILIIPNNRGLIHAVTDSFSVINTCPRVGEKKKPFRNVRKYSKPIENRFKKFTERLNMRMCLARIPNVIEKSDSAPIKIHTIFAEKTAFQF